MLTEKEHLLSCLAEECAEVAQVVSKTLRFGIDNERSGKTNLQKLNAEIADVFALIEMIAEAGIPLQISRDDIEAKKLKLALYMEYSRSVSLLEPKI